MRRGRAQLALPAGDAGRERHVLADWWFPERDDPVGLVWLQHGFTRRPEHLAGLAGSLVEAVGAIVVAPAVSSRFWSRSGLWINGAALHDAVARLFANGREALAASATVAAGRSDAALPAPFVLAGHSAGGNLAAAVAGRTTGIERDGGLAVDDLRGVVLFDGVDRAGAIGQAVDRLVGPHDRPVWTIAAPDSWCNARGRGTELLRRSRPGRFVGVRLLGGSHVDAEGADGGRAAGRVCGAPRPENVEAVRALAADWIGHLLRGTPADAWLSGTAPGTTSTVGRATAITL